MDLGAYANIGSLSEIAENNGIRVPRLRGYRLMRDEQEIDIRVVVEDAEKRCLKGFREYNPNLFPGSNWRAGERWTRMHMVKNRHENSIDEYERPKWEKIHGKKRKALKRLIKEERNKASNQYKAWNKYCGRDDVLYIHARIGGPNWEYYGGENLTKQPWFLERVDDCFDYTYCDIYAKINKLHD